jgi:hypothetical protein
MHETFIALDKREVVAEGKDLTALFIELRKIYTDQPHFLTLYKEGTLQIYREVKCGT